MCIRPNQLNNGVLVGCRKCWQCRENRVNDWVGRCIAESKTATASVSATMTYGRDEQGRVDHARAALLTYSDLQRYFRALRDAGTPARYFAVGEYGARKGRTHWHVLLFFQGQLPAQPNGKPYPKRENFQCRLWRHGHVFWDDVTAKSARYVCKYLQKDIGSDERQGHLAMSKKPPLGSAYFDGLARRYAEQGLAPQDPFYSFPDVLRNGEKIRFYLKDRSLDLFCAAYLRHWAELRGGHPPVSPLIDSYSESLAGPSERFYVYRDQRLGFYDIYEGEQKWGNERGPIVRPPEPEPLQQPSADYRAARGR